jgi:homoserine O-succinyltransferase/O-acetyltransferase
MFSASKPLKIAILDLYAGQPNEGMRCIRQILQQQQQQLRTDFIVEEFEVRLRNEVPTVDYDIYISSGGPGSPLPEASIWEKKYFSWFDSVLEHNRNPQNEFKKHALFICHSFQLVCRYLGLGNVSKRRSTAFGVFPVHLTEEGKNEIVFRGLNDPFYAVDSRDYQVIETNEQRLAESGSTVLAIEKERPHVPLERAVMAMRINDYMLGTQFHPEADPEGMTMYLKREDKKSSVIENHGFDKWQSMIDHLNDPDKILWTYSHVLPNFLEQSIQSVRSPVIVS